MVEDYNLGHRALLRAILYRAIQDYAGVVQTEHQSQGQPQFIRRDAERWLFKQIPFPYPPFSFYLICEFLDLDPKTTRKNIRNLTKQDFDKKYTLLVEIERDMDKLFNIYPNPFENMPKIKAQSV